ncbi:hypothetical protein HanOQP8_Chr12g0462121 [Helianthus annuus]|nr:hypothetical protein HanOQP8_Chr12g0462121 [Helianthus annuus]
MEPLQDNVVDGKITIIPESTANQDILVSCDEYHDVDDICPLPISEFNSPLQVTPLFRSMAAGIPSPQFSESVSSFLTRVNVHFRLSGLSNYVSPGKFQICTIFVPNSLETCQFRPKN